MAKAQSGGQAAAQFQIEQHGVVVGGAVGIGGEEVAHRGIAVAVCVAVVVAEGSFGGIDVPVEGGRGLGHERGGDQHVIQGPAHVHRGEEGVARGWFGREAGQGIAIPRRFKHLDWIFFGVGVEVAEHHPVGISVARGIGFDPLQQPGGSCGAGGVEGCLAIPLIEIGTGGIGGALRLEMVDHHIHGLAAGQFPEGLGQSRAILRRAAGERIGKGGCIENPRCAVGGHGEVVVDQAHLDGIAADQAGGHMAVGAARISWQGPIEPIHDGFQRGVVGVVLQLHQADHIGLEAKEGRGEFAELTLQFLGCVGAAGGQATVGKSPTAVEGGEGVEHVEAGQSQLTGGGGGGRLRPGVLAGETQRSGGVQPVFAVVVPEDPLHSVDRVAAAQQLIAHGGRRRGG